jgi:hypothetical protein
MKSLVLVLSTFAAAVMLTVGCTSTVYNQAKVTTTSIEETAVKIQQGYEQIDAVLFTLSSLIHSTEADIRAQFAEFTTAVSKLETLSNEVNTHAASMQVQGADYFRTWDIELAKIQNENIRKRSTERKNAVAARFDGVRANYARAKTDFAPFMADLMDIRTALAVDLTAGGLVSIQSASKKAHETAQPLRQTLRNLAADFTSLGISLSPATAAR